MNFLEHEESPLEAEEWSRLNDTVIQVARRTLVGRRFIDIYGPLGAGVQTIARDEFTGSEPGAVDIVGEQETATVFADRRQFLTIPIIYKDFILHWRDIQSSRAHHMPLDVSAAAGAAAFCAQREDELIFYGDQKLGHEGLFTVRGRSRIALKDWTQVGNAYQNIVEATETLLANGHYGPYAVVTTPQLYASLHRVYERTGVLEIDNVRKLATEGVYQSNVVKEGAVVVSCGRENLDLAVSLDMVVAYLGAEHMNHPFRVLECLALRVKHPDALCTLEAKAS
jgi:uncharacterized linocin/CFP29 family protein